MRQASNAPGREGRPCRTVQDSAGRAGHQEAPGFGCRLWSVLTGAAGQLCFGLPCCPAALPMSPHPLWARRDHACVLSAAGRTSMCPLSYCALCSPADPLVAHMHNNLLVQRALACRTQANAARVWGAHLGGAMQVVAPAAVRGSGQRLHMPSSTGPATLRCSSIFYLHLFSSWGFGVGVPGCTPLC